MSQTNAQLLADSLGTASTGIIPIGGIILWSGSVATIPDGYALCNGSNGTPNLRNKFILGAYSDNASVAYPNVPPNSTGGSANAVVVSHNHAITDPGHAHSTYATDDGGRNDDTTAQGGQTYLQRGYNTLSNTTGITINDQGVSGTNANLPPYYALAYIMRTS